MNNYLNLSNYKYLGRGLNVVRLMLRMEWKLEKDVMSEGFLLGTFEPNQVENIIDKHIDKKRRLDQNKEMNVAIANEYNVKEPVFAHNHNMQSGSKQSIEDEIKRRKDGFLGYDYFVHEEFNALEYIKEDGSINFNSEGDSEASIEDIENDLAMEDIFMEEDFSHSSPVHQKGTLLNLTRANLESLRDVTSGNDINFPSSRLVSLQDASRLASRLGVG